MLIFNIIAAISLLLGYIASYIGPDKFWPAVLFGLAYPVILFINILFVVYWLLRFKRWILLSLITIAIGWGYVEGFLKLSGQEEAPEHRGNIRIMSFNVKNLDRESRINKEKAKTRNEIFKMISREAPDVICFQVFYCDKTPEFSTVDSLTMSYGLPYYDAAQVSICKKSRFSGTATFSKYPIIHTDRYQFSNILDNIAIITDIVVKRDTFRIFNVHFKSNMLSDNDRQLFHEIPQSDKQDETVNKFKGIINKIKESSKLRASQSRELRALVESSPYPVIFCCDLNDTHASYAYRQVKKNLKDSFVESGKGFGSTHIGLLPVLRIDYILHDPFFESWGYKTVRERLSDHYPIVTNLAY